MAIRGVPVLAKMEMNEFWDFVNRSVPFGVLIPSFVVLSIFIVFSVVVNGIKKATLKNIVWALVANYVFLVLWSTVIDRDWGHVTQVELMPLWNADIIMSGKDPRDLFEIILNILLFMPIGLFLYVLIDRYRLVKIATACLFLSITIEVLQYTLKCGLCETNDVINNTLGGMIGWWSARTLIAYRGRKCEK